MPRPKPADAARIDRVVDGFVYRINLRRAGKQGLYQVDIYLRNGQRTRQSTGTADLEEAKAVAGLLDLKAIEQQIAAKPEDDSPTVAGMADWYLKKWLPNQGLAVGSLGVSRRAINEFVEWGKANGVILAGDASVLTIEGFKAHLFAKGHEASTVAVTLSKVRAMYKACASADLIPDGIVRRWHMPKAAHVEVPSLEPDELAEVLRLIADRRVKYQAILRWMAYTGNRPSDAMALQWSQVDLSTRTVRRVQVKTKMLAEYQVSGPALALLLEQPEPHRGLVFRTERGRRINKAYVAESLRDAVKGTPFEWVTPKTLRHTFAFVMANHAKCPLPILQRLMGHSDIATTMKYVRGADAQESLAAMSELLNI